MSNLILLFSSNFLCPEINFFIFSFRSRFFASSVLLRFHLSSLRFFFPSTLRFILSKFLYFNQLKKSCITVSHPSTIQAQCCLTSIFTKKANLNDKLLVKITKQNIIAHVCSYAGLNPALLSVLLKSVAPGFHLDQP